MILDKNTILLKVVKKLILAPTGHGGPGGPAPTNLAIAAFRVPAKSSGKARSDQSATSAAIFGRVGTAPFRFGYGRAAEALKFYF